MCSSDLKNIQKYLPFISKIYERRLTSKIEIPSPFKTPKTISWSLTKIYVIIVINRPSIDSLIALLIFSFFSKKFELIPEIIKKDMAIDNCHNLIIIGLISRSIYKFIS